MSGDSNETILNLLANHRMGRKSGRALVDWAAKQMIAGNDSKSLVLLAGLLIDENAEAEKLFFKALGELGYPIPQASAVEFQKSKNN